MVKKSQKTALLIFLILVLIYALFSIYVTILRSNITSNVIEGYEKMYTKAICDGVDSCRDYEIICKGNRLVKLTPTTFAVQQENDKNNLELKNLDELCS